MKEITIKLYTFDELSDEAKKRAHNTFLSTGDYWGASGDATATIKKVEELFGVKLSDWEVDSYNPRYPTVTFQDSRWNDDALYLKGNRARAYLWNNFGKVLLTGRYYSKWHGTKYAHSRLFFDRVYDGTCPLKGVCFDCDALDPMAYFCFGVEWSEELKKRVPSARDENALRRDNATTVEGVIRDCVYSLFKAFNEDCEASESMDYFAELCEVNGWTFEEDGTMRNAA